MAKPRSVAEGPFVRLTALLAAAILPACGSDTPEVVNSPAKTFEQPRSHLRMVEQLKQVAQRADTEHEYLGDGKLRELRALVASASGVPWLQILDLAKSELRYGLEREGIQRLETLRDELVEGRRPGGNDAIVAVAFYLGVGLLRLAETENCCAEPNPDSCILPIQGGGLHQNPEGSSRAIPVFLDVIKRTAPGSYWHNAAIWLVNLAHMTLGTYPEEVPAEIRLPEKHFTASGDFPRFRNVAGELDVDRFSLAGGVVLDDFDGDDLIDILASTWHTREPLRLYRNAGDGTFTDVTEGSGLDDLHGGLNMVQADYDNDGDLDVFVLRGAWLFETGRHPNSLIRNNGDGTFSDVTYDAGLARVNYPTQAAAWADFDLDGDLDLYVGNESSSRLNAPSQLFRNEGDGTFVDIASAAGVRNVAYAKGVSWGDYDGDGDPDLYVSNTAAPNRLYRNNGDATFTDVASDLGVDGPESAFPAWFWDYDNDGVLDIYASAYDTGIGHLAAWHLGLPADCTMDRLYRGRGDGTFEEVGQRVGLDYPTLPMGGNFGDLDGDGFLDFYLGTGDPPFYSLMPNVMWRNVGGQRFENVTMSGGFGHLQKGHGVAFADLDNDGDLDVFEQMGGAYRGDAFRDALFENPGFGHRWVALHLVGTKSNRSAIGARLSLTVRDENDATRRIVRHVNSGGTFGANPLRQTIGLGAATRIEKLEIRWPSGATQELRDLPLDAGIRITEQDQQPQAIALSRMDLGG